MWVCGCVGVHLWVCMCVGCGCVYAWGWVPENFGVAQKSSRESGLCSGIFLTSDVTSKECIAGNG